MIMAGRRYPFVVNNRSDEAAIEKAIQGLRNMVDLGKKAQEALDALERDGHYDKTVVFAELNDYDKGRLPNLKHGKFPAYCPVSREDLPGLANLTVSLGRGYSTQYGGHCCVEYVLSLTGTGVTDEAGKLVPREIAPTSVGQLRVSSRTISFLDGSSAWFLTNKMKRLDLMLAKVAESGAASRLAINVKRAVVTHDDNQQEFTQRGLDLWRSAEDWIRDDGHSLRLLRDAIMALHCKLVMDD
jgi:hypothetical protein